MAQRKRFDQQTYNREVQNRDNRVGTESPVEVLTRWEETGAVWRVVHQTPERAVIALLTCTAGEEVDRLESSDPALLAFVETKPRSDI